MALKLASQLKSLEEHYDALEVENKIKFHFYLSVRKQYHRNQLPNFEQEKNCKRFIYKKERRIENENCEKEVNN